MQTRNVTMKPSNMMQTNLDKSYKNEALNGAQLEVKHKTSINPWLLVLGVLFATSIGAMMAVGVPNNIKAVYFDAPKTVQVQNTVVKPKFMDAFVWTAKLKLEDLKLNHRLQVSVGEASELVVKGNISKEETQNWQTFLSWYESKDGFPNLQHSVETTATSGNIPELKSVWFDTNPTAYFTDGRSGNIGTLFEDGWKIVSIEAWAVFVERDGNTIMLNY